MRHHVRQITARGRRAGKHKHMACDQENRISLCGVPLSRHEQCQPTRIRLPRPCRSKKALPSMVSASGVAFKGFVRHKPLAFMQDQADRKAEEGLSWPC